ncbi:MAG: 5-bromo-4-chloroindolyl phosphate hydrolysis family protein [Leptospiraceae bacterium]|nr:5-bromo-4-chloroindolyl phosphate hydrolysis family protein [Leptospiraceae bacterium]
MSETKNPEEQSTARNMHLASLLTYPFMLIPGIGAWGAALVALISPLLISISNRKSNYVKEQALEAGFFQVLLSLLFFAMSSALPADGALNTLLKILGYAGIGIYHLGNLLWATISTSYGKDFKHLFSPFRFIRKKQKEFYEEKQILSGMDEVTKSVYGDTMKNATMRLLEIANISVQIQDIAVKNKVAEMIASMQGILEEFKKDPKDVVNSRHFVNYSLDSMKKIISKYVDISSKVTPDKEMQETLSKVLPVLETMHTAIEAHKKKLLEDDVRELDAEMKVMEKTIEMGGF